MNRSTEVDVAYCAGLFEGRGSIFISRQKDYRYLNIVLSSPDLEPLYLFKVTMRDVGNLDGPYERYGNKRRTYRYSVIGFEKVQHVISTLWPWLSDTKKDQYQTALKGSNIRVMEVQE